MSDVFVLINYLHNDTLIYLFHFQDFYNNNSNYI